MVLMRDISAIAMAATSDMTSHLCNPLTLLFPDCPLDLEDKQNTHQVCIFF